MISWCGATSCSAWQSAYLAVSRRVVQQYAAKFPLCAAFLFCFLMFLFYFIINQTTVDLFFRAFHPRRYLMMLYPHGALRGHTHREREMYPPTHIPAHAHARTRFIEAKEGGSGIAVMVLRSTGGEHEAASSPYRHVDADTPKSVISADRFLVACGTRPVR